MATSGSISNTRTVITYTFEWSRTSVSIPDNTSTISWKLYSTTNSYIGSSATMTYDFYLNGNHYSLTAKDGTSKGSTAEYGSGTLVIPHNADGSKTFSFSLTRSSGSSTATYVSGTGTLDNIPRKATISTAPNFTDEENPTITYSNPVGSYLTELQACIANSKGNAIYVPYRDISKTGTSYTFNLTIAERNALRAAASGSSLALRFYVKSTIGDDTSYSFLDRTMTLDDIEPTLAPTVKDTDATIVALTGDDSKIILGFSDVYYNIGVTAPAGTSIITQTIRCGAQSSTTNNGTFANVDTNVFEFSATDSRGNTGTEKIEMDVVPYFPVSCRQTVRLNKDGTVALTVKGNYFNESFGAVNNELFIEHRVRKAGEEWSAWESIHILTDDISNGTYTLYGDGGDKYFDPSGTYEFQTRAYDKLTSAESDVSSVTLKPIFDWGKYDFNFNVPLTIEGDPLADYVIEESTEAMYPDNPNNGTWYWRKWRSGRAECYGCRNYGNMAVTTAWGSLFRSETFTQSLPSGLFVNAPEVIDITFRGADRGGWIANHEETAASDYETGSFILVRPASATLSQAYISFHVIGRWK